MTSFTLRAALAAALALAGTTVRAQDGNYDQNWAAQGSRLYSPSGHPSDFGGAIAVQSSGRFIVAGDCWRNNAPAGICVGAMLPNASSDNGHFAGNPDTAGFVLASSPEFPGDHTLLLRSTGSPSRPTIASCWPAESTCPAASTQAA